MLYSVVVHPDARRDLDALLVGTPDEQRAAATVLVLLQELKDSQTLLDSLTDHDFGAARDEKFHVSKWQAHWRKSRDIWRLKVWELEEAGIAYRVVYAYEIPFRRYHVLGIVPRSFNYDVNHPLSKRMIEAYDAL